MPNTDPQHRLLVEARDTLHRLDRMREETRRAHGSGETSPDSPMRRITRLVSAALSRVERRREACVCSQCVELRNESHADEAGDRAYDQWVDDQLTGDVRHDE